MIKIYNRNTKKYEIEKVAGARGIDILYNTKPGKIGLELMIKRKFLSRLAGLYFDSGLSKARIKPFIDDLNIDMNECSSNYNDFKSFNEFFVRKLKPDARPFNTDDSVLISPGDGRMQAWMNIDMEKLVQVKGSYFTLRELVGDDAVANRYKGGCYVILRLCPTDYHRFHFIDKGVCSETQKIKGAYYSVNPSALYNIPRVFCRNKREYSILYSENFGDILYMEVGATFVGSIIQTYKPETIVKKGDEKGYFKFGGSTVILFFKKDTIVIDDDIVEQTLEGFETSVKAGEKIGRKHGSIK